MDWEGSPAALAELLRAAQRGDLAAFNGLVRLYQRRVYNVCYRTLGNAEDAADATQETFFSAYRAIGGFRGGADGLLAWLLRIAGNACYDQLRRRRRRPTTSLEAALEPESPTAAAPPDPAPGPEQQALSAETAHRIQTALDGLPPDQRLTVVLCDVQGLSYEEAARAMGVELGTVKSRLSRARGQLRVRLAALGELPAGPRRLEE